MIPLNSSVADSDVKRLSKQCEKILHRLRQGPATNFELAQIALKYTGRIDEIRQHLRATTGERLIARRVQGSEWIYRIEPALHPSQLGFMFPGAR